MRRGGGQATNGRAPQGTAAGQERIPNDPPEDDNDDEFSDDDSNGSDSDSDDDDDDSEGEEESFDESHSSTGSQEANPMTLQEYFKDFKKIPQDETNMFEELGPLLMSSDSADAAGKKIFDYIWEKVFLSKTTLVTSIKTTNGRAFDAYRKTVCSKILPDSSKFVYRCLDCALIESSIICPECYVPSKHIGHRIFRDTGTNGGGICDCGDPSFWKREGNCRQHSGR